MDREGKGGSSSCGAGRWLRRVKSENAKSPQSRKQSRPNPPEHELEVWYDAHLVTPSQPPSATMPSQAINDGTILKCLASRIGMATENHTLSKPMVHTVATMCSGSEVAHEAMTALSEARAFLFSPMS